MSKIATRSPDDGLDPIILISVALVVMVGFVGWSFYMCSCRPAPAVRENPSQEQSIPLQNINPEDAGPGVLLNPPLRTGPRLQEDEVNPRGRPAVQVRGGRIPVRMHGGGTRMHGAVWGACRMLSGIFSIWKEDRSMLCMSRVIILDHGSMILFV